jgi:predicted RNA-binding protein with PUA-like domain
MTARPRYWLMKSEPNAFSFEDLMRSPNSTNHWDGVRNYQARNYMRQMRVGDQVLFYHSSCEVPGIVGICEVVREAYPDHTQFDPQDAHYEPKATPDKPIWDMVDIQSVEALTSPLALHVLRQTPGLEQMVLLQKGSRLSVQPVTPEEWQVITNLARAGPPSR